MLARRPCCYLMASGWHLGCRPELLRLGRRAPMNLGCGTGVVSRGLGCRPELLRLEAGGLVDLGLGGGLGGEGTVVVLVLADREPHQDGPGHDHCRRDDVSGGPKPTTAFFWPR